MVRPHNFLVSIAHFSNTVPWWSPHTPGGEEICPPPGFTYTSIICQTAWEMNSLISRFWKFLICFSLRGLCDSGMWLRSSCSVIQRGLCCLSDVSDTEAEQSWRSLIIFLLGPAFISSLWLMFTSFWWTQEDFLIGPNTSVSCCADQRCSFELGFLVFLSLTCLSAAQSISPHIIRITWFSQAPMNVTSSWFQWRLWFKAILFNSSSVLSQS